LLIVVVEQNASVAEERDGRTKFGFREAKVERHVTPRGPRDVLCVERHDAVLEAHPCDGSDDGHEAREVHEALLELLDSGALLATHGVDAVEAIEAALRIVAR